MNARKSITKPDQAFVDIGQLDAHDPYEMRMDRIMASSRQRVSASLRWYPLDQVLGCLRCHIIVQSCIAPTIPSATRAQCRQLGAVMSHGTVDAKRAAVD
jgi:hypothetical protein